MHILSDGRWARTSMFIVASLYLGLVAWNQDVGWAIAQLLVGCLLLSYADGHVAALLRAWRLLRWLLFPLILLHALFTPGALFVHLPMISEEGLKQGLWLSLHLAAMYLAAMVFTRLLSLSFLLGLAGLHPRGKTLIPLYVRLMPKILQSVRLEAANHARLWKQEGSRIHRLPFFLALLVKTVEQQSRSCAQSTLQQWHQDITVHDMRIPLSRAYLIAVMLLLVVVANFSFNAFYPS